MAPFIPRTTVQWDSEQPCSPFTCVDRSGGNGFRRRLRFHATCLAGVTAAIGDRAAGGHRYPAVRHWWSSQALRACGVSVRVNGVARPAGGTGVLVVANHISWLDMPLLNATFPGRFVAKADIAGEGYFLRYSARLSRVVLIERKDMASVAAGLRHITDLLRAGETIAVFPEAASWCGRHQGTFRPAFFQAAIDAGVPVQPVAIRYLDENGDRTTAPAFIGAATFRDSLHNITASKVLTAEITFPSQINPLAYGDRRSLARAAQNAVAASWSGDSTNAFASGASS